MIASVRTTTKLSLALLWFLPVGAALGNGGPFVLKYPGGDPAAKGVLARLDEDLKPQRESRLRVIEENLDIRFKKGEIRGSKSAEPPLVAVSAAYKIENPTDEEIEVDFGFPILRGIYTHPFSMRVQPSAKARLGEKNLRVNIISTSAIYSMIRQRAREVIEKHIAADPQLAPLVARTRVVGYVRGHAQRATEKAAGEDARLNQAVADDTLLSPLTNASSDRLHKDRTTARDELYQYLTGKLKWNDRDARLMVEFASLDFGQLKSQPRDRSRTFMRNRGMDINSNLGPLSAIGEQKATQFFAKLSSCFEPEEASAYESIFKAWGGDVRERSLDLGTGKIRPREIEVSLDEMDKDVGPFGVSDPTIYARVDYLDPKANISEAEKASCKAVLKNLPVIFTFAPMNLLHYQVKFAPKTTETLTVTYEQYAFTDTGKPESYQLAYVVHPASLWDSFGPIHLKVSVPEGVSVKASVPIGSSQGAEQVANPPKDTGDGRSVSPVTYSATVTEKTGELFVAVDAGSWKKVFGIEAKTASATPRRE